MAEREYVEDTPGTANPGDPSQPPLSAPPAGFQWTWVDSVGQWQLTRKPAASSPGSSGSTGATTLAALTRAERDVLTRGTLGNLEGFMNRSAYGDDLKARNSVKNTFATIASRYASKPSSLDAILNDPDFKRLFPNAKRVGVDKIDFGGILSDFESGTPVGIIDVLTNADATTDTGRGWWWGYDAGGTGPTTYRAPAAAAMPSFSGMTAPTRTSAEGGSPWTTEGFLPQFATETPDTIYARNRNASLSEFGQAGNPGWQTGSGTPTVTNAPRSNQLATSAGMFAAPWAGPGMTLATLGRGIKNVFSVPKGRRVPGRL